MYSDVEVAENVDEDFLSALALLRSCDVDSADKLRQMLDLSIEKKSGKTLARRVKTDKENEESIPYYYRAIKATGIVGEFEDQLKLMEKSQRADSQDRISSISTNVYNNPTVDHVSRSSSELCETDLDDDEVPRISIPDETTGDGIVCKVCTGDKLGPLILLECQECQDVYHPLCHQPPVVDIDIYDPRIVWRCGKCIDESDSETACGPFVVNVEDDRIEVGDRRNWKTRGRSVVSQASRFTKLRLKEEVTKKLCAARAKCGANNEDYSARKTWRSAQKKGFNSRATSHLRKRVGSKLSVSRDAPSAN